MGRCQACKHHVSFGTHIVDPFGSFAPSSQTALLPDAQALTRFSVYLTKTRPALSPTIAFPGCPRASDLDCLAVSKLSSESPLTEQDVVDIKDLHSDLVKICARAQERGIRIIIDAEHRQV